MVCSLKGRRVGRVAANSAMQRGASRVGCGARVDFSGPVLTKEPQTRIQSADWPDTPSATCLTNRRHVFVSRQGSNASVMVVAPKAGQSQTGGSTFGPIKRTKRASLTGLDSPLFGGTTIRQGLRPVRSGVCRHTGEELPDCRQFV